MVMRQFLDDGVINHAPIGIDQRCVKALSHFGTAQIAWGHQLHQLCCIFALNSDLPLATDVPKLHVLAQMPVIFIDRLAEPFGQNGTVNYGVS